MLYSGGRFYSMSDATPGSDLRVNLIHHPHHHRTHGSVLRVEHLARAVAFVEDEDVFVGAAAGVVGGDEVVAVFFLDDEEAFAFVETMFDRSVDLADDAREDHAVMFSPSMVGIMAWSTGTKVSSSASAASRPPSYDTSSPTPAMRVASAATRVLPLGWSFLL